MVYLYPGYTAHAQTYLINENFNNESTVFSLLPSGDTLAWKFSKHGGVSATSCLVSELVTNSNGGHANNYFAVQQVNTPPVGAPCCATSYTLASTCNPAQGNRLELHPDAPHQSNLSYHWQRKADTTWLLHAVGYTLALQDTTPDGLYRLKVTLASGQCFLSNTFHSLGHDSVYTDTLAYTGDAPVYFHRNKVKIAGLLRMDSTLFLARGMASYYPDSVGGTVAGSYLYVAPNAALTVSASTLKSACQNMWGGIRVDSVADPGNGYASIEITDSSKIEDAYIGIGDVFDWHWAYNHYYVGHYSPPRLTVRKSAFKNCLYGIRSAEVDSMASEITRNRFTSHHLQMKAPFDYTRNSNRLYFRPGKTTTDGKFLTAVGMWTKFFNLHSPNQFRDNVFNNMGIGILGEFQNRIHHDTLANCHIAAILGRGCENEAYHHNRITLPSDLSFKTTYQMEALGDLVFNPSYPDTAYTYGLYFRQECDNIKHTFESNYVVSPNSDTSRFHVGMGNNGFSQKARYFGDTLENLSYGIRLGYSCWLTAHKNVFKNNETGIGLFTDRILPFGSTYPLDLKCNTFEHDATDLVNRKGLVIGKGVKLRAPNNGGNIDDAIGGENEYNTTGAAYPNANVWPTTSDRDWLPDEPVNVNDLFGDGWQICNYWVAIENQTPNTITYHRFSNEFVGYNASIVGSVQLPGSIQYAYTQSNPNTTSHPLPAGAAKACEAWLDPLPILFPTRIAVVGNKIANGNATLILENPFLGDAIPNPASYEAIIPIGLPAGIELAFLQILETGTGKILQNIPLEQRGKLEARLSLEKAPAGMYEYRLLTDGKPGDSHKLVVMH